MRLRRYRRARAGHRDTARVDADRGTEPRIRSLDKIAQDLKVSE